MRRLHTLTASALVLAFAASAAHAQSPSGLPFGATIEASLDASDPVVADWEDEEDAAGPHYDDYAFTARAGQRIEAIMRSDAFDAFLGLYRQGEDEEIAYDDDGLGEGLNARLRFTPEQSGTYVLRARSYWGGATGAYTLSLADRGVAPRAPRPSRIRVGQTVRGELNSRDPEAEDGGVYDAYALRLRRGERVAIRLNSEDFDPVLRLGSAGVFNEIAMNDDGGGEGLNSLLFFTAPEAGEYVIRATAFWGGRDGAYELIVETGPPPVVSQPIAIGDSIEGELSDSDGVDERGQHHDSYRFSAQAGTTVDIQMASQDFDTYLILGREAGGEFEVLGSDDDGAGVSTNSRLQLQLEDAGEYIIRAMAFSSGGGAYTLSLGEAAPDAPARPLPFGEVIQDSIEATDSVDARGRRYDAWTIDGRQGQRVQIVMRSGDFDSYLQIGAAGGAFTALASDDDGLGEGLNSRLRFTLPETGAYVVRASPLGSQATGLYSLELSDRGREPTPGSILIGATARGTLDDQDNTVDHGAYFDAYRFTAEAGDQLRITMVSNAFDALVFLGRERNGAFEMIASDDDSLSDTNARLDHTITEAGEYVVRASSYGAGSEGGYVLTLDRR
jgi:hypothetical protein